MKVVKEAIAGSFEVVNQEDIIFIYKTFADSSINFETRFWIDSTSALEVAKAKSKAFDKHGINIPFPIRTLDFPKALNIHQK